MSIKLLTGAAALDRIRALTNKSELRLIEPRHGGEDIEVGHTTSVIVHLDHSVEIRWIQLGEKGTRVTIFRPTYWEIVIKAGIVFFNRLRPDEVAPFAPLSFCDHYLLVLPG